MEALKALMYSAGYGDHASYAQQLGGWELLTSPERHSEGVTLLARYTHVPAPGQRPSSPASGPWAQA